MINGKRICVVMPAYNAEKTLQKTYDEIPKDIVDEVILTDDASKDKTVHVAEQLGIKTFVHTENKGYGGNQKTCYQEALNQWSRYRHHVAPGLSVHTKTHYSHGINDCRRNF